MSGPSLVLLADRLGGLPSEAVDLWLGAHRWLGEHGGNVIPRKMVDEITRGRPEVASHLVRGGLWDDAEDDGSFRQLATL